MTILYTGREPFNPAFPKEGLTWGEFTVWNGFDQMSELLSLDQFLNAELEMFNRESAESACFFDNGSRTGLYTSLEYVRKIAGNCPVYNLLAVVKDPEKECAGFEMDGFEFAGYDLIDKGFGYSALSNLGGILSPIKSSDLNEYGLISQLVDAQLIQSKIGILYTDLEQAQTHVMAIWRHKWIGREEVSQNELYEVAG